MKTCLRVKTTCQFFVSHLSHKPVVDKTFVSALVAHMCPAGEYRTKIRVSTLSSVKYSMHFYKETCFFFFHLKAGFCGSHHKYLTCSQNTVFLWEVGEIDSLCCGNIDSSYWVTWINVTTAEQNYFSNLKKGIYFANQVFLSLDLNSERWKYIRNN